MNDKCEHCRFWNPVLGLNYAQDDASGVCRRNAPSPVVNTDNDGAAKHPWTNWPLTSPTDGCGEFKASAKHMAAMERKLRDELDGKAT